MIYSVLIMIVCVLLTIVVLVQNSKGGFQNHYAYAKKVTDVKNSRNFIERSTWTLAIVMIGLCILMTSVVTN